jgi:hypothetical protein
MLLGSFLRRYLVGFVDLVERLGCALALGCVCLAPKSVVAVLCPWWAVESYILVLLL